MHREAHRHTHTLTHTHLPHKASRANTANNKHGKHQPTTQTRSKMRTRCKQKARNQEEEANISAARALWTDQLPTHRYICIYVYIYINIPWYTSTSQIYKQTYIYTYTNISRDRERCICACICATAHVHHKLTDRWRNYAGTTTKTKTTHEPANTINKEQSATDTSSCYRFVCGNSLRFMAKWWIIFLRVLIEAPLNGHLNY